MTGRRWAYLGGLLGGGVSIAANVAHSYVPPAGAPAGWHPHAGAVVGAVFWPVALFVAIEILARVLWPAGRRWVLLRFGGLLPVAAVAAVVSYRHLSGLLDFYREDGLTVVIGPLAVDGLMVMATGALIATSRARRPVEPVTVPDETRPAVPAPRRAGGRPSTAAKVAKVAARMPDATPDKIAAKTGLSSRTVRRHLAALTPDSGPDKTPVNNHTPDFVTADQGGTP